MCWYFCIGFVDFTVKGKSLLYYTNLFSSYECKKNDKNDIKIFSITKKIKMKNYIALFVVSIENLKILKYHRFKKTLLLPIIGSKCKNEDEKSLKKKAQLRY